MRRVLSRDNLVGIAKSGFSHLRNIVPGMGLSATRGGSGSERLADGSDGSRELQAAMTAVEDRLSSKHVDPTRSLGADAGTVSRMFRSFVEEVGSMMIAPSPTLPPSAPHAAASPALPSDSSQSNFDHPTVPATHPHQNTGGSKAGQASSSSRSGTPMSEHVLSSSSSGAHMMTTAAARSPIPLTAVAFAGVVPPAHRPKCTKNQESTLCSFFVICRKVFSTVEHTAAAAAREDSLIDGLLVLVTNPPTRRLAEGSYALLLDVFLMSPTTFHSSLTCLYRAAFSVPPELWSESPPALWVPRLKLLTLLYQCSRSTAASCIEDSNDPNARQSAAQVIRVDIAKCFVTPLTHLLRATLPEPGLYVPNPTHRGTRIAIASLAMCALSSAIAGVAHGKREVRQSDMGLRLASLAASLDELPPSVSCSIVNVIATEKTEDHVVMLPPAASIASELVELFVELSVENGFPTKHRQRLLSAGGGDAGVRRVPHPVGGAAAPSLLHRWEPMPANWDEMLLTSPDALPWRLAASLSDCLLTESSAAILLQSLADLCSISGTEASAAGEGGTLPVQHHHGSESSTPGFIDAVGACICAYAVCLCRALPSNASALIEADGIQKVVSLLSPNSQLFASISVAQSEQQAIAPSSDEVPNPPPPKLWDAVAGLLSTLWSTAPRQQDVTWLLEAVRRMSRDGDPTREDCDVFENIFSVLASTNFSRRYLHFDGATSRVVVTADRFCGRWNGYSVSTWISPNCVWSEGGSLVFSIGESNGTSGLALCVVAQSRSQRCLAVRAVQSKDQFSMTLLPEAVIAADGIWTHVGVVHNISGYFVYINGRKVASSSMPYPKDPVRPSRLLFAVGGADRHDVPVQPMCGKMGETTLFEGNLSDRDMERIAALGCARSASELDPPLAFTVMARVQLEPAVSVGGTLTSREAVLVRSVAYHQGEPPAALLACTPSFAVDIVDGVAKSPNRSSVVVLLLELLAGYLRQTGDAGASALDAARLLPMLRRELLLDWEASPPPEAMSALFLLFVDTRTNSIIPSSLSQQALYLLVDAFHAPSTTSETRAVILRELADFLVSPANLGFFIEQVGGVGTLLWLSQRVDPACISECVSVLERFTRDANAVEQILRMVVALEPDGPTPVSSQTTMMAVPAVGMTRESSNTYGSNSSSSRRAAVNFRCEILRMLYDVAKPNEAVIEALTSANAVNYLQTLVYKTPNDLETLRIYGMRLLALILHCSRRAREAFLRGGNSGFEILNCALLRHTRSPLSPIGLPTFNCLFKMALDFYQPSNSTEGAVLTRLRSAAAVPGAPLASGGAVTPHAAAALNEGHFTTLVPQRRPLCRTYSLDIASVGSSELGDMESRLSIDETYQAQHSTRDALVHPPVIGIIMSLFATLRQPMTVSASATVMPPPSLQLAEGIPSDSVSPTAAVSAAPKALSRVVDSGVGSDVPPAVSSSVSPPMGLDTRHLVLAYMDRMVDISHNAAALHGHPWLEWIWDGCGAEITRALGHFPAPPQEADALLLHYVRRIVRKISVHECSKTPKSFTLRRVRDFVDCPLLTQIVLEEVMRHFSANNRLDTMDAVEAANVLKNLESLLLGIEDVVPSQLPASLGFDVVAAISAMAANNPQSIRQRMKSGRLFEIRDKLAYAMLTGIPLYRESPATRDTLRQMNQHDTASVVPFLLRVSVDAVRERHAEQLEAVQSMLRMMYAADDEVRRAVIRCFGDPEVCDAFILERRVVDGLEVPLELFASWVLQHEAQWEACSQRIVKAAKTVDAEIAARSEKREKERSAKLKQRRLDVEKRASAAQRWITDTDRMCSDVEVKCDMAVSGANADQEQRARSRWAQASGGSVAASASAATRKS